MADNTTKVPNKIVIIALKLTSKASAPYFATPELSRNVSFSRNPREEVARAKIYTNSPNNTCHGTDSRLNSELPPG